MKSLTMLLLAITVVFLHTYGQKNTPDEQTIVNKEYDEDGNLIAFDSTYIHKWSDTTFNFHGNDFFAGNFEDLENYMKEFMDNFEVPNHFSFPQFDNEEFFKHFEHSFPDSVFMHDFNFEPDSMLLQHNFAIPDLKDLQKQMEEHFKDFKLPEPPYGKELTDEQEKELKELMKKHQKEMEELKKKWKKKE